MKVMARVIPGEAKPCTQARTRSSKWRVSPSRISWPSQPKSHKQRIAATRLATTAASNNGVGLVTSSGPAISTCASGIPAPGATGAGQRVNQLVQFGQQRMIAAAGIGRELFREDRQVEEK